MAKLNISHCCQRNALLPKNATACIYNELLSVKMRWDKIQAILSLSPQTNIHSRLRKQLAFLLVRGLPQGQGQARNGWH